MGRKEDYFAERDQIKDDDQGRYNVTKKEEDRHKFKVPTLRNLAVTYPYFHDGRTKILSEAIGMMAIYQFGEPLTVGQVKDIEKFLLTLTGEYNSEPLKEN
ncbi:MAG: hypothetical protein ACYTAO_09900 [Planctomycetota bacterium]|jgi:cytochrome c peroxidase